MAIQNLSDQDLLAISAGNMGAVSDAGLKHISAGGDSAALKPVPKAGAPAGPSETQNKPGIISSAARGIGSAVPFNNDISAAAASLDVGAHELMGKDTGGMTMGSAYDQAKKDFTGEQESAAKDHPFAFYPGMVAGAVTAGGAVKNAATRIAPGATSALAGYAAANPYKAASITGAVAGGLYGMGAGSGSISERTPGAVEGAAVGATLSPLALYGANKMGDAAGAAFSKLKELAGVGGEAAPPAALPGAETFSDITGKPTTETPALSDLRQKNNVIALSPGQRGKDVDLLRMEDSARQGNLGKQNQAIMANIDAGMTDDVKAVVQSLAGNKTGRSDEIAAKSIKAVQGAADAMNKKVNLAYTARNEALAGAVGDARKIGPTLGKELSNVVEDPKFKYSFQTKGNAAAKGLYDDFVGLVNGAHENGGDLPIGQLTAWRTDVSDLAGSPSASKQTQYLARQLGKAFDGWLDGSEEKGSGLTADMLKSGDANVGELSNAARQARAQYGRLFESNTKIGQSGTFENFTEQGAKTPLQFAKDNFSNLKGNSDTSQLVKRMIQVVPDSQKTEVGDNVFHAAVTKAFENANDKTGFSMANLRNGLSDVKNSVYYRENLQAMDPERDKILTGLISDLNQHLEQANRRDVISPSGGAVMRGMNKLMGWIPGVPASAKFVANAKEAGQEVKSSLQLQKALKEAGGDIAKRAGIETIIPRQISPTLSIGAGAATGATVGKALNEQTGE